MDICSSNAPVANNIERIIKEKGMKQRYCASKIGCSAQEFNAMLKGKKIIRANDIPKISRALGVEISELFTRHNENENKVV